MDSIENVIKANYIIHHRNEHDMEGLAPGACFHGENCDRL